MAKTDVSGTFKGGKKLIGMSRQETGNFGGKERGLDKWEKAKGKREHINSINVSCKLGGVLEGLKGRLLFRELGGVRP